MKVTDDLLQNAVKTCFPQIFKVALEIGYDNGMINRFETGIWETEEHFVRKSCKIIGMYSVMSCIKLEIFLSDMTDNQLETIAVGEETEMKALMWNAPDVQFANALFNNIFEGEII